MRIKDLAGVIDHTLIVWINNQGTSETYTTDELEQSKIKNKTVRYITLDANKQLTIEI